MLDYDVVVATRNRLDMLGLTLPLFLAQSRKPARIIVVDRSDDHDSIRALCERISAGERIPVEVHYGDAANLPAQRNQGIERVESEVVLFPDDDSMWFPDTAERVVSVFEADSAHLYGAVSAVDVYESPVPLGDDAPQRRTRLTERPSIMRVRNGFEAALVPQPFEIYGRARSAELSPAARAAGLRHPLVGTIGGYRMSFRTETAKRVRFDPVLGSKVGYGTHEDKDMALRVLREGQLIAVAEDARVFHNVHPGKRAGGFEYGYFHVLNYVYICRKVMPDPSPALAGMRRYLRYKVALYRLRRGDDYGRDVHRGALVALTDGEQLLAGSPESLADRYETLAERAREAQRAGSAE
ncbi:glycosyltransferase [Microbacterium aurum]|uniref:glycosyltransferase family 2 protein n=1 Tax=Microbacterium aurum TaxID=36805 RepID=UPI0028E533C8|nr:glycosyltransferase [Microbacterium aurum]